MFTFVPSTESNPPPPPFSDHHTGARFYVPMVLLFYFSHSLVDELNLIVPLRGIHFLLTFNYLFSPVRRESEFGFDGVVGEGVEK